jgi:K+-sensing histidine kinase KdpD
VSVALILPIVYIVKDFIQVRNVKDKYKSISVELEESNTQKELLLDILTHDLKNSAGVIHGISDHLFDEIQVNDEQKELLDLLKESSHNLLDVIDNTIALSSASTGSAIKLEDLDLSLIIKNVLNESRPHVTHAGMSLDSEIEDKLIVKANPIISQVIINFINNAAKYGKDGKKISVKGFRDNSFVRVQVADLGSTIPEENREIIFNRTVKFSEDKKKSRGLGLAIARRIADAHDATVGVIPNQPTGNIFMLKIPAVPGKLKSKKT